MPATTVVDSLNHYIFSYFRIPAFLKSNNHNCFTNDLLREVCRRLQITPDTTVAYNWWSGLPERLYQDLGKYLMSMLEGKKNRAGRIC